MKQDDGANPQVLPILSEFCIIALYMYYTTQIGVCQVDRAVFFAEIRREFEICTLADRILKAGSRHFLAEISSGAAEHAEKKKTRTITDEHGQE